MGEKKVRGRKRHLQVDTDGLVLGVFVLNAHCSDAEGGAALLVDVRRAFPTRQLVWVDASDRGLVAWAAEHLGLTLEVVPKDPSPGFHVAPWRWVIERTFAWVGQCRRLAKDVERSAESADT